MRHSMTTQPFQADSVPPQTSPFGFGLVEASESPPLAILVEANGDLAGLAEANGDLAALAEVDEKLAALVEVDEKLVARLEVDEKLAALVEAVEVGLVANQGYVQTDHNRQKFSPN